MLLKHHVPDGGRALFAYNFLVEAENIRMVGEQLRPLTQEDIGLAKERLKQEKKLTKHKRKPYKYPKPEGVPGEEYPAESVRVMVSDSPWN